MPQVIEQGDIFGKIGKSFGEGLSEQIPKEIGRMRLKEGLKNFSEKTKDLSYPEQVAYLYGIPGVAESGIGNVILPYMQSEREREASTTFNKGQGFGVSEKPPSKEGVSAVSQEQPQEPEPSNLPPKFDRSASNYLTPLGAEDIDLQARELSSKYKIPFSRAQEIVQRKDDKRIAAEQAFEARNTLGESEYNKYLDTEIQKSKEAGLNDIIGELRNDYLTKVQNDIANGLTPRQAGLSRAKELLDFSKARNKLKIQGTSLGGEHKTTLEAAKRAFDKIGNPELFKNDLINNQKLSLPYASQIAFPLSKDTKEYFNNLKPSKGIFGDKEKVYKEALNKLSKKDSLQTFALQLQKKGYSPQDFLTYVLESGKNLEPMQERELQDIGSFQPSYNDIYYFTLIGREP